MVTGGAGFIGSHIVEQCVEAGHIVAVLDNLSHGTVENLVGLKCSIDVVDIRNAEDVLFEMQEFRPDVVCHHAAVVDVQWCEGHPTETNEVNVAGTQNVFRAACMVGAKSFILASSAGGYGECPVPVDEHATLTPIGAYGQSKVDAERAAIDLLERWKEEREHTPSLTILRYSNVYGPRARGGVIPAFLEASCGQKRPEVFGDGEQIRDFVHVDDVARANLLAMKGDPEHPLRIVNIASGHPVSINRLWTMVSAEFLPARSAEIVMSRIDASLAADALGFTPEVSLRQGLVELMALDGVELER
jgi:UDP-glucose 4-epimerase